MSLSNIGPLKDRPLSKKTKAFIGYVMSTGKWDTLNENEQRRLVDGCEKDVAEKYNGEVVRVNRGGYYHYGIYVMTPFIQERVIHYTPEGGGDFNGIVRETSLKEFLDGQKSFEFCNFDSSVRVYSGDETVRRARSKLGMGDYNIFFNNCEHFATWCKTGKPVSLQVSNTVSALLSAIGSFINGSFNAVTTGVMLGFLE